MTNEKRTFGSDVAALVADYEESQKAAEQRQAFLSSNEQRDMRAEIIKAAYASSKADYALKTKIFIYYVKQVKAHNITLPVILANFEEEVKAMFRSKTLKALATDKETQEGLDEKVVMRNIRRMFTAAADRYDSARGTNTKGADEKKADPLAPIRTTFEQSSITNIADAFWQVKKEERKVEIIKELFSKLTDDSKEALLFDLEAIVENNSK